MSEQWVHHHTIQFPLFFKWQKFSSEESCSLFFPDIFCTFSPASTANDWNVQVFGIFDVEQLVHHLKLQGQLSGLKRLRLVDVVNYLFDAALPVSKSVTMSNWEVCPFLLQPSFQKLNLSILLLEEKARKNAEHK